MHKYQNGNNVYAYDRRKIKNTQGMHNYAYFEITYIHGTEPSSFYLSISSKREIIRCHPFQILNSIHPISLYNISSKKNKITLVNKK